MKADSLGKYISLLYRYSQIYFNTALKRYQLGSGQYIFLLSLLENEGINQEQLAELVKIDKTTTARAVAKLVEAGYIARETSPHDRRAYILHTTGKTRAIEKELEECIDAWYDPMLEGLSNTEREQLHALLRHATNNVVENERIAKRRRKMRGF